MTDRFKQKVALVTGAGAGVGKALTLRLAAEGAEVLALDVSGKEDQVARECGGKVVPIHCDVSDPGQVEAVIADCRKRFGRLDLLFNNAGISGRLGRLHEYDLSEWDRVMAVNLRGAFLMLKHAVPLMIESGGGAVVNTASLGGFLATVGVPAYIASKGGMVMLTRVAALDYVNDGIRVNAVCPAGIESEMTRDAPQEIRDMLIVRVPMKRLARPEEVVSLALFLASEEASFITGQCYIIDGGRSAG